MTVDGQDIDELLNCLKAQFKAQTIFIGVSADVFSDLHRAKMRAAHCLVVELARGHGIEFISSSIQSFRPHLSECHKQILSRKLCPLFAFQ
jgi:hypothetical protein